ncbi:hypothetical protein D3C80_1073330 [compost metagenome]
MAPFRNGLFASPQPLIECLCTLNLLASRLDPYGLEAYQKAIFENGSDVRIDPVIVAILAAIFYYSHPAFTGLQIAPHHPKNSRWHVGMANQIVWATDQFPTGVAAYFRELIIAVGDVTAGISS